MQMIETLTATLAILLSDLFLYLVFTGVGLGIRRAYGLRTISIHDVFIAFWVGFSGITLALMVWHFLLPVADIALLLVIATGLISIKFWWADLRELVRLPWSRAAKTGCVFFLLLAIWIANAALGDMVNWDSALYHLQAIQWAEAYPVVPGIANLYGPLAFNNTSFLYGALLNAGPWQDHGFHIANGLLIIALLPLGITAAHRLFTSRTYSAADIVALTFLIPTIALVTPEIITSHVTDAPATAIMLVVIPLIFTSLSSPGRADGNEGDYRTVAISALLAAGVCMKFHIVVFAGLVWPLLIWFRWFKSISEDELGRSRSLLLVTIVPVIFAASLAGRGIVQSGYPLFPSDLLGMQVDWKAPVEHARAEYNFIVHSGRASARLLGMTPGVETFTGWFPLWLGHTARDPFTLLMPVVLAVLGGIASLFHRRQQAVFPNLAQTLLLISVLIATVSWFSVAPAPRYASYLFWTCAGWCIAWAWPASTSNQRRLGLVLIALAISAPLVVPVIQSSKNDSMLPAIMRANFTRGGEEWMPSIKPPASRLYATTSGAIFHVPVVGPCRNLPIPCTPNPAPNVELRDPDDLGKGFRVKGEWQMEQWPYSWLPDFLETSRTINTQ